MGLHLHLYGIGMGGGNSNKLLLSSAGAMFTSLSTVPHRRSTQQEASYARVGLVQVPSRWNATIFIACNLRSEIHIPSKIPIFQPFDSRSHGHAISEQLLIPFTS